MRLLAHDTNMVFGVRAADGRRLVVRVGIVGSIQHPIRQIRSEMNWLAALADSPILAPVPLETAAGERVVEIDTPGIPGPRPCVVMEWIPGHVLEADLGSGTMEAYGGLAAGLHEHGAGFVPSGEGPVPRHDEVFPFDEPVVLYDGDHRHLPPERRARFIAAAAHVEQAIAVLATESGPMQVLHGDLHIWNVLKTRRGLAAIDFEDHLWGWPIQDLGIALYYLVSRPEYPALLEAFRRGYERVRLWPERRTGELETFIMGRALVLANDVILLERAGEPGLEADRFFTAADQLLQRLLRDA